MFKIASVSGDLPQTHWGSLRHSSRSPSRERLLDILLSNTEYTRHHRKSNITVNVRFDMCDITWGLPCSLYPWLCGIPIRAVPLELWARTCNNPHRGRHSIQLKCPSVPSDCGYLSVQKTKKCQCQCRPYVCSIRFWIFFYCCRHRAFRIMGRWV